MQAPGAILMEGMNQEDMPGLAQALMGPFHRNRSDFKIGQWSHFPLQEQFPFISQYTGVHGKGLSLVCGRNF